MSQRKDLQAYPQTNLSNQLLLHQQQMLQFLFFTNYDIVYETFQLQHGSYSQRNRGQITQSFKSQQIAKHYQIISEKVHLRILRDDIDLDKQLGKLQIVWHNRNIPYFHRYYFLKFLYTCYLKNIQPALSKEEQLLRTEEHLYYPLFKSINARQACLRNLKKMLAELTPSDVYEYLHTAKERLFNERRKNQREKYRSQGYKLKLTEETYQGKMSKTKFELFSDSFNHLTKLSLYVIELIVKWKQYIRGITHDAKKHRERVEYYFYDDNYYLKILTDLGFLKVSFLQQFYEFAPKNDPFLLYCVLAFEKKKEKTVEHQLLKAIFMPQKEHLAQIMNKIQFLSEEYRYNIRSRKTFDVNVLKKPLLRVEQKQLNNEKKEQISNLVLKKIQSPAIQKKSKSVSTFRVRDKSGSMVKKQQIVVEFKNSPSGKKKLISIPGVIQKSIFDGDKNNPLKNSVLLQKNENSVNMNPIDMNLINTLKHEVIKKMKEDMQLGKATKNQQSQALQLFIDAKIKETIKSIFPFEPEKHLQLPLEFSPLSISDINLPAQIEEMFKHSLTDYRDMQLSQVELIKLLQQTEYIYILVGKIGDQQVGRVICSLEKGITEMKVLKILYLHFLDLSEVELLIIKFVSFLWQYENSFEVHYNFFQPTGNELIGHLIGSLEKILQKQCLFGRKQLYSTVTEIKLIFKRPTKNINYVPNRYPFSFHLQFSILLAHKKLMLENRNDNKNPQLLNYDFFLAQIIKRLLSAQEILTLKEKVSWRNRLKLLVQLLKEEETSLLTMDKIHQLDAHNVSQLNGLLTKIGQPFMELSDLVKGNQLSLLSAVFTLTPNFEVKAVSKGPSQKFYRMSIMKKFDVEVDEAGTQFFLLPVKQSKDYYLLVFNAKEYLNSAKTFNLSLSQYLIQRISKREHDLKRFQRVINCLWMPMVRYPQKYKEREDVFYHTTRVLDLAPLQLDLFVGEKLEWFCNLEMENSIKFTENEGDRFVDYPFGVAVVTVSSRCVLYSRVFY